MGAADFSRSESGRRQQLGDAVERGQIAQAFAAWPGWRPVSCPAAGLRGGSSSSTASADESKRSRAVASTTTLAPGLGLQALQQHLQAGHWPGCASINGQHQHAQPFLALFLLRSVSVVIRPSRPLALISWRKLAAIGLDQPDAQHIEVEDSASRRPGRVSFRAVVELDRVAPALDFGAHHHFLVFGRGTQGLDLDGLVADLRQGTGVGAHQQGLELLLQALLLSGVSPGARPGPTADAVMRWKLTLGMIFWSTSATMRDMSPFWMFLSALMLSSTSVDRRLISASGASSSAYARGPAQRGAKGTRCGQPKGYRNIQASTLHLRFPGCRNQYRQHLNARAPPLAADGIRRHPRYCLSGGVRRPSSGGSPSYTALRRRCRNASRVKLYLSSAASSSASLARSRPPACPAGPPP
jgi:hypothetical protein